MRIYEFDLRDRNISFSLPCPNKVISHPNNAYLQWVLMPPNINFHSPMRRQDIQLVKIICFCFYHEYILLFSLLFFKLIIGLVFTRIICEKI